MKLSEIKPLNESMLNDYAKKFSDFMTNRNNANKKIEKITDPKEC